MTERSVVLKAGREKSVKQGHPWIFSGAIHSFPEDLQEGELLPVLTAEGTFLALAYFHPLNSLAGRILSFEREPLPQLLRHKLQKALVLRPPLETTAVRLVNAEGDGLPGLIVDRYADILVLQVNTWGMERLKPLILEELLSLLHPKGIYEKSLSSARQQEGLSPTQGVLYGEVPDELEIQEHGVRVLVSLKEGQKTGLFLDQRAMRQKVGTFAKGKKVLNCFSYTGGFALAALKGGATHVTSVDVCSKACRLAEKNSLLNGWAAHTVLCEDAFHYLQENDFDQTLFILDPPAFAKKKADVERASAAYRGLNRLIFEKAPPQSHLFTFSCSYHIDEKRFQKLLFQAACEVGRSVCILGKALQAIDHPISLYHPEGEYLKGFHLFLH